MFKIETLDSSNIDSLSEYDLKCFVGVLEQLTKVGITDLDKLRKYIKENSNATMNKKVILIVRYGGVIVGTGSILIENKIIHDLGKVGHIEDIVIDSKHRGKKLANKLMEELVKIGETHKCYKIILEASDDVAEFYKKLGFNKIANSMRINCKI